MVQGGEMESMEDEVKVEVRSGHAFSMSVKSGGLYRSRFRKLCTGRQISIYALVLISSFSYLALFVT